MAKKHDRVEAHRLSRHREMRRRKMKHDRPPKRTTCAECHRVIQQSEVIHFRGEHYCSQKCKAPDFHRNMRDI